MNSVEFLAHVLPHAGPYCIARGKYVTDAKGKRTLTFRHIAAADIDAAAAVAIGLDRNHYESYFAVGTLVSDTPVVNKKGYAVVSREASNIRNLRAFFLDLDIGPNKYTNQREALTALIDFTTTYKLPKPTITSSGGGLHVYWTVENDVPRDEWITYATSLKALTGQHKLINDSSLIANAACVLRVVGTHNWKDSASPREVKALWVGTPTPNEQLYSLLGLRNLQAPASVTLTGTQQQSFGPSNIDRYANEPISPQALLDNCQTLRYIADPFNQMQGKDAVPEPAWWMAVTFSASMTPADGKMFAHAISSSDPRHNPATLDERILTLRERRIGPPPCAKLEEAFEHHYNAGCCDGCPSQGKIKSPAVLAHRALPAPPILLTPATSTAPAVFVPDPPFPYRRSTKGIVVEFEDKGVKDEIVVCPYDMYPTRLSVDDETGLGESAQWRVNLPKEGWVEMRLPYAQRNQLGVALKQRGIFIDESELPTFTKFMTAYTRHLQNTIPRERTFSRLGFTDTKTGRQRSFVLGDSLYKPDGTIEPHSIPQSLLAATDNGIQRRGEYDDWRRLIMIYCNPNMDAYRVYLYSSFGSILYHMTTFTATAVCAVGETGRGKSTLLDACASIWGDPSLLRSHGGPQGFTLAGVEAKAHALYHLPMLLDDATEQEAKEIGSFIFNYSGGRGKIRSQAGGGVRADTPRWENILLLTGNEDEYARMAGMRIDSRQHTMRLIQIEFNDATLAKSDGDLLRAGLLANFGWAGHLFVEYVVKNYDMVKKRVEHCIRDTDIAVNARSEERYWTAWKACAQVAAEICANLGILPNFPVTHDAQWMEKQIIYMRNSLLLHDHSPNEVLSEFLDACIPNTLTLSAVSGNIDNVRSAPRSELLVRHEVDTGIVTVSTQAFYSFCLKRHVSAEAVFTELIRGGALLHRNAQRILGADTTFGKGNRVRCFVVDTHKLSGAPSLAPASTNANVIFAGKPTGGPALKAAVAAWHKAGKP